MSMFAKTVGSRASRRRAGVSVQLEVEVLESRVVPYAVSGGAWPSPQLVTISFVPDGTIVGTNSSGYAYSNLFAKFNARFGSAARWEAEILRAAQSWAQQTNLNFAVVSDNGTAIGQGSYQQGDPGMGDIRIGGYSFGNGTLAQAYMPPPLNNYSIAGDIQFNTGQTFNINGFAYDLFTVAAHEFGHALGLNHSSVYTAEMYPTYNGVKRTLSSDDTAGIRNIYSNNNPRSPDTYDSVASNDTEATATNLTSLLDLISMNALVTGLDITTTSDVDYFTVTAPLLTTGTLTVGVQSTGLSLLTPAVTIYAGDGSTVLTSASGAGQLNGSTLTLTVNNVLPLQQFYFKVAGADSTAFSTGAYAMSVNFGIGTPQAVTAPSTQLANGNPIQGGGGQPDTPGQNGDDIPGFDTFHAAPAANAATVPSAVIPGDRGAAGGFLRTDAVVSTPVIANAGASLLPTVRPVFLLGEPGVVPVAPATREAVSPASPGPSDGAAAEQPGPVDAAPQPLPRPALAPAGEGVEGRATPTPWREACDSYFAGVAREEADGASAAGPADHAAELQAMALLAAAGLGALRDDEKTWRKDPPER
jgi:hypothetical protein